jgi:hypothetical protein
MSGIDWHFQDACEIKLRASKRMSGSVIFIGSEIKMFRFSLPT